MGYLLPAIPQCLYFNIQNICGKFDTYQCPPAAKERLHFNSCPCMCENEAEGTETKGANRTLHNPLCLFQTVIATDL